MNFLELSAIKRTSWSISGRNILVWLKWFWICSIKWRCLDNLRQSTSTPPAQDQNATGIDMSPIMREVQSLRNELSLMKQAPSLSCPAHPMAKPASPAQSACAGFPHPTPALPIHKTSGPDFWSISTPTQPIGIIIVRGWQTRWWLSGW